MTGMRVTGLASGLDVDALVKKMMSAENAKLDKVKQDRQLILWKQDTYRELMGNINVFTSSFYDVLKSDAYMLSPSNLSGYDTFAYDYYSDGSISKTASTSVSVTAGSGVATGQYILSDIQVATKATYKGYNLVNTRTSDKAFSSLKIEAGKNDSLNIKLNDKEYNITIPQKKDASNNVISYASAQELADVINNKLTALGINATDFKAVASADNSNLKFQTLGDNYADVKGATIVNNSMIFASNIDSTSNKISITIDNKTYNDIAIQLDDPNHPYTITEITDKINAALESYDNATTDDVHVRARISPDGSKIQFYDTSSSATPSYIKIQGNMLYTCGFASNNIEMNQSTNDKMSNLVGGQVKFKINGSDYIEYDFSGKDKDKTIASVLSEISAKGKVVVKYNEMDRRFTMTSLETGAEQKIDVSGTSDTTGQFLKTLFGSTYDNEATPEVDGIVVKNGTNAQVTIQEPGSNTPVTIIRSNNSFTVNGMTYNLLKGDAANPGKASITVTSNSKKAFDKIKAYIDKYNEIISGIQTKLNEKKQYTYKPLTDDQKKEMKEDEIKKWEEVAKKGIMKYDENLQNMLYSMRRAFYDSVEDVGISLDEIGLSTSNDYLQGGKIILDETKLKTAIENKGTQIADLFAKSCDIDYDPNHKTDKERYGKVGIFQRINDIIKDYTRTSRDSNGKKGILVEKAGLKGDLSEITNLMTKDIENNYDKKITALTKLLAQREEKYYKQFSQLEVAMQKLNEQSNWLTQQLGGGQ